MTLALPRPYHSLLLLWPSRPPSPKYLPPPLTPHQRAYLHHTRTVKPTDGGDRGPPIAKQHPTSIRGPKVLWCQPTDGQRQRRRHGIVCWPGRMGRARERKGKRFLPKPFGQAALLWAPISTPFKSRNLPIRPRPLHPQTAHTMPNNNSTTTPPSLKAPEYERPCVPQSNDRHWAPLGVGKTFRRPSAPPPRAAPLQPHALPNPAGTPSSRRSNNTAHHGGA